MIFDFDLMNTLNVLADSYSNSDGGEGAVYFFGLSLFLLGPIYYAIMYARYRNAKARHKHEKETQAEVVNLQSYDQKVKTLRGVSNASLSGSNHTDVRGKRN